MKERDESLDELRRRAEDRLRASRGDSSTIPTSEELQRLVHELEVHQIELEMQNEELQHARSELESYLRRYTDLYDFAPVGYLRLDPGGRILQSNLTGARMLGVDRSQMIEQHFSRFVSADSRSAVSSLLDRVFQERSRDALVVELEGTGNEASYVHVEAVVAEDGRECRLVLMDVTLQQLYQQRLEYLIIHDALTGLYNRAGFAEEFTRLDMSSSHPISVISLDVDGLKLVNDTMGHHSGDEMLVQTAKIIGDCVRARDVAARVGGDEFVILLPGTDATAAEMVVRRLNAAISDYNEKQSSIPLNVSLGVATTRDSTVGLSDTLVEADARMYHDKLSHTQKGGMIHTVLMVLAERDYIAEGHADRMDELSRLIGIEMNLSLHQTSNLSLLAHIHDLGKVGIPDSILNKPGPLAPEEWVTMRQHPWVGFRIASSSRDLAHIADLILQHHEYWDGSGYPLGISGRDIPIECRIIAVVDAYDAMTNTRPYRLGMTHEEAMAELRHNAGVQFDPEVVEIFANIIERC